MEWNVFINQEIQTLIDRTRAQFNDSTVEKVVLKELCRKLRKMVYTPKGMPIDEEN